MCVQNRSEVESGRIGATFEVTEVSAADGRLVLQGILRLELPVPKQDEHLPHQVEQAVEDAGQRFKRWAFQQLMEKLDAELILAERGGREGRGIVCRGRRSMWSLTRRRAQVPSR